MVVGRRSRGVVGKALGRSRECFRRGAGALQRIGGFKSGAVPAAAGIRETQDILRMPSCKFYDEIVEFAACGSIDR